MKNYFLLLLVYFVTVHSKSVPDPDPPNPPSVPIGPFDTTESNTSSPQGNETGFEKDDLFQGDIRDPGRRPKGDLQIAAPAGTRTPWPNGIIPYVFDCSVLSIESAVRATKEAIKEWESRTCVRFVEKQPHHTVYLEFIRAAGCWATFVGYKGKKTQISIGNGCDYKHVMVHELGHVIGFWHEQSRPDRDNHVTIDFNNVIPALKYNFNKVKEQTNNYGEPYDLNSIMHYPLNAFAVDRRRNTIHIKNPSLQSTARPYRKLSVSDATQTKRMYKCHEVKLSRATTMREIGETKVLSWATTKCQDHHKHCKSWAGAGFCTLSPDPMLTTCPQSCGICGTVCEDKNKKDCPAWADYGYCISSSRHITSFMLNTCQKSCAVCTPAPTTKPTTKPTTTLPPTTTAKPTTKSRPTTRPPPVTTKKVQTTRKVASKNGISIPSEKFTGILCTDRSRYCPDWEKDGRCKTDRWVHDNCLKSCKRYSVCDQMMIKPIGRCTKALGVYSDRIISDHQMRATTTFSPGGGWYAPASSARLYKRDDHRLKRVGAWCAAPNSNIKQQHLQIDFGQVKRITALATQGRDVYFEHVKSYSLSFSNDGRTWRTYREGSDKKVFDGNCDHVTPVMNLLENPQDARYMRIHPIKYIGAACLRVEVYGC